jgi:Fic-DOC domain mobile mystery protein B
LATDGDSRLADWGDDPEGATPIDGEQREGLRLSWIGTKAELNEAEADNIVQARLKWRTRTRAGGSHRLTFERLLDHATVRDLHQDMYGDVWSWAGQFRQRNINIGIDHWKITEAVSNLLSDTWYWVAGEHPMPLDRAACRFHHKLVEIHPFPNGNGRHAREMADLLLLTQGAKPFTWGSVNLVGTGKTRKTYISALIMADNGDYTELEAFVRT